jgi:hypothetical protein
MTMHRWVLGLCLAVVTAAGSPCAAQLDNVGPIAGDLDGDSFVGLGDLLIVIEFFGQTVTPGDLLKGDPSGDGAVGIDDLSILLANWNIGYPLPQQRSMKLGVNLSQVNYYNREWVFVDAVKQSKPWVSTNPNGNPFDTGEVVQTDPDGWPLLPPGKAAQTLMFSQTQGAYPAGQYICTYDGAGDIQFQWDAQKVSSTPGRIVLDVTPSDSGILMRIADSDPSDPIRNIRLWMPGFENAQSPFHPLFLQRMAKFKVLRFMDWARTNQSRNTVSWSTRTLPTRCSQDNPNGVAIEYMIDLCNELGADAWFCMPHAADEDYIQSFATLVRDRLDPGLNIYIEWSNEVWNRRFDAYGYVESQSGSPAFSKFWFEYWAEKLIITFKTWEQVFAGQEDRLVRVAAGQAANVWVTRNLTDRLGDRVDAVSCSGYFGESGAGFDGTTTAQDLISDALNRAIPDKSARFYQDHGNLAAALSAKLGRPIRFIGYEGGQHYADDNRNVPYAQALLDMQYLPGMFSAYLMNLDAFERAGGDLMIPFNYVDRPGNHGAWGHLEHQDDSVDSSEKFRALLYYIKDQP